MPRRSRYPVAVKSNGPIIPMTFNVTATWDPEAEVFCSQSDIPGLVVEAETFDEFVEIVRALAPDMIAANLPDHPGPYSIHVEARRNLVLAGA